jgi:ABC-type polysaccharide/polyol phosphate export permease
MREEVQELWKYRELLLAMTERELKIRYKNSVLGFFWSLAMPMATVVVMTLVFKFFLGNRTENYSAYVLAAYLPFLFINTALLDSAQSVLVSLQIVKKVYFPREILPLSTVLANFIHFALSLGVFFAYLLVIWASSGFQDSPFTLKMLFLPVLLFFVFCFTLGSALIISALNVFYEDVKYALNLLLYLIFFLTPVMYFSENVFYSAKKHPWGDLIFYLYHANPLATIVTTFRRTLLPTTSVDIAGEMVPPLPFNWGFFSYFAIVSVAFLFVGYALFNRLKWRFVERP